MTSTIAQAAALFTVPGLAAAGALAVSIPIAIHLLWRLKRRPEPWGAMRFLVEAYRKHRQRLRFEQWLLLAVRCLIVAVLGFALSGPMLGGCVAQWAQGIDGGGRVIHLVIDDSLSTRAQAPTGEQRFEKLCEQAAAIVDAMGPADKAMLWRLGRPTSSTLNELTQDRAALRETIDAMQTGFSRSDMVSALQQISEQMQRDQTGAGQTSVVLLSDFSAASHFVDEPVPSELQTLGQRASLWALPPATSVANVQIASMKLRRNMVLVEQGSVVAVELQLARFGQSLDEAMVGVDVALVDEQGDELTKVQREQRFARGQRSVAMNVTLPISAVGELPAGGTRSMTIRAQLDAGGAADALQADNHRLATLELREQLNIAIVDDAAGARAGEGLLPAQWVALALQPGETINGGAMRLQLIAPAQVNTAAVNSLDAVLVLRPDLLPEQAWQPLAQLTTRGGLVWVFTPAVQSPAVWGSAMQRAFGLNWRLGLEQNVDEAGQEIALNVEADAPEALEVLAADWQSLLQPIRVQQRLPLRLGGSVQVDEPQQDSAVDAAKPTSGQAWLELSQAGAGDALLAAERVGDGHVLLLATALDDRWTNLMTKPMFVPLLHETLRGLLGSAQAGGDADIVAGDQPALGSAWRLAQRAALADGSAASPGQSIAVQVDEQGNAQLARAVTLPGRYVALPTEAAALQLAVNVDASAGNTQAAEREQVQRWLDALGGGAILEDDDVSVILQQAAAMVDMGWPLLWVLLGLIVLETVLARILSHAKIAQQRPLGHRLLSAIHYLRRDTEHASPTASDKEAA